MFIIPYTVYYKQRLTGKYHWNCQERIKYESWLDIFTSISISLSCIFSKGKNKLYIHEQKLLSFHYLYNCTYPVYSKDTGILGSFETPIGLDRFELWKETGAHGGNISSTGKTNSKHTDLRLVKAILLTIIVISVHTE